MENKLKLTARNIWIAYSTFVLVLLTNIKFHIVSLFGMSLISLVIYLGPASNKIDLVKYLIVYWILAIYFLLPLGGVIMKFFPDGFKPEGKVKDRLEKKGYL